MSVKEMDSYRNTNNMNIRKIPLGPFIEILTDLFDNGTDFIDISGENNAEGDIPRDMIKISIKPDYMMENNEESNDEIEFMEEEIEMDYSGAFEDRFNSNDDDDNNSFSPEDIDNLIQNICQN